MILAGDIGGTNARLAVFELDDGRLRRGPESVLPSRAYRGLDDAVRAFFAARTLAVTSACFGVAGPVKGGRAEVTNLPWVVDARELSTSLGIPRVVVINDLEASAYGIGELGTDDLATIHEGAPGAVGNAAVIAAGTGLGEAGLFWDGARHHAFACEGGHADFAPRNELEADLLRYLLRRWDRVSYERVLSGPGLFNLYTFLRDTGRGEEPPRLRDAVANGDPSTVVTEAGLRGESELCVAALDLFATLYGAEAGNLALKLFATGGVYLGGGIAPKILPKLREPAFAAAFTSKGRMRPLMDAIPVHVVLNGQVALLGAARRAAM